MARCLVVYYSWTGYTQKVAWNLAERLDADVERIRDVNPRGVLGHVAFGVESALEIPGKIVPGSKRPADYDVVVIGTPVWALNVPPPVRAWLERESGELDRYALFCTQAIVAGDRCLDNAASICSKSPVARVVISDTTLLMGTWHPLVDDFVAQIKRACA
jgi:multimeric flavodoxin WrbA